jgi:hypothetical protein
MSFGEHIYIYTSVSCAPRNGAVSREVGECSASVDIVKQICKADNPVFTLTLLVSWCCLLIKHI